MLSIMVIAELWAKQEFYHCTVLLTIYWTIMPCEWPWQKRLLNTVGKEENAVNLVPNNKNLDFTSFKAMADNNMNMTKKFKIVFLRVKKIMGKREKAGGQHFLQYLQKISLMVCKSWDCVVHS